MARSLEVHLGPQERLAIQCDAGHMTTARTYAIFHNWHRGGGGSGMNLCAEHFLDFYRAIATRLVRDKLASANR